MGTTTEKLARFFEQLKTLTFWQRLFGWSQFRSLSYDAYEEFKALFSEAARQTQELDTARTDISILNNDNEHLKKSQTTLEHEVNNLKDEAGKNAVRMSELGTSLATKDEALRQSQDKLKDHEGEIKSLKEKGTETSGQIQELTGQLATRDEALRQNQEKLLRQENEINGMKEKLSANSDKISELTSILATKDEALRQAESRTRGLEIEVATSKERVNGLTQEHSQLKQQNTIFKQTEDDRKTQYDKNVAALNAIREKIQTDRNEEIEEHHKTEIDRLNEMKETWARHQDDVKNAIKTICDRHTIEYVEHVPFKGSPDNAIKICDEFVIFDAKEENVRKEIYLVINDNYNSPSATIIIPHSLSPCERGCVA